MSIWINWPLGPGVFTGGYPTLALANDRCVIVIDTWPKSIFNNKRRRKNWLGKWTARDQFHQNKLHIIYIVQMRYYITLHCTHTGHYLIYVENSTIWFYLIDRMINNNTVYHKWKQIDDNRTFNICGRKVCLSLLIQNKCTLFVCFLFFGFRISKQFCVVNGVIQFDGAAQIQNNVINVIPNSSLII